VVVADVNALGYRGEVIFQLALIIFHGERPLFRVVTLGEKWPVADFLVELIDRPGHLFLVQVKSTQQAIARAGIPVAVNRQRLGMLLRAPLPTYLVAVHEPTEAVYVVRPQGDLRHVPQLHSLKEAEVRQNLYNEVAAYWERIAAEEPFVSNLLVRWT
jgi:hypothetical protein